MWRGCDQHVGKERSPWLNVTNLTSTIENEPFVWKLAPDGNLLWARQLAGNARLWDVELDSVGSAYMTGESGYPVPDFDPGPETYSFSGGFVWKLTADGNLAWAKQYAGSGGTGGEGIAVDQSGTVYSTGSFEGTVDFDPGSGLALLCTCDQDIFVAQILSDNSPPIANAGPDQL